MADLSVDSVLSVDMPQSSRLATRHVVAVAAGNALEFYDFLIYSYFAVYIGKVFFPAHGAAAALLMSLATFGAGFLTRPIGAVVIGRMGDRKGRKPAMLLSFTLMGVAVIGLALTPSYALIGMWAPVLVLFFRLLQGFALGGEVGPSTAFLIEAAAPDQRGFYTGLQNASQLAAQLFGGLVGTMLAALLDAQQLQDWGWRLAMLVGAAVVPFGLFIRRGLPETLHGGPVAPEPVKTRVRVSKRLVILGLMMLMAATISTYVGAYMTTYALTTLHMSPTLAFGVTIVKSAVGIPILLLGGWLSDRLGRKPIMLVPGLLLLISILPAFSLITRFPSAAMFYGANIWLSILGAFCGASILVTLCESMPKAIRSGAIAMIYAFAISIFGGSTQFVLAWLLEVTKDPLVPAYYWIVALTVGLIAMALVQESSPAKLARRGFALPLQVGIASGA